MRTARWLTIVGGGGACPGGCLPGGCLLGGVCLPRGGVMWPIPSCIWCYLYAASTPTECRHLCSSLYSVTQVHAGIPTHLPPVNRMTNRCKNITLPQTSFAGGNKWTIDANNVWKRKYNGPREVTFSLSTDGYFSVTLHQSRVEKMPLELDNEGIGRDLRPWISHSYSNRIKYIVTWVSYWYSYLSFM